MRKATTMLNKECSVSMNMTCPCCGSPSRSTQQPCPYCGLIRLVSAQTTRGQSLASRSFPLLSHQIAPEEPGLILPILAPGTALDRGHYLLLEIGSIQQWGPTCIETRWRAQEIEPETQRQRYVTIADVALPTFHQRQVVSQAARRAFMRCDPPILLNAFMEQNHCFFVFASEPGETLQQRIDQFRLLREEEAVRCLQVLTRTLMDLSHLQPPVMHGWICPAHLLQRGEQWQVLPGSVLFAGDAARFLDETHVPLGVGQGKFDPGKDLFAAFQTVYAGLTGVMPPPVKDQGLPQPVPSVSAPFAALLARGLQAGFRNPDELWAIIGDSSPRRSPHRPLRGSGALTPSGMPSRTPPPSSASLVNLSGARATDSPDASHETTPSPFHLEEVPVEAMAAYPPAHDGRLALCWSAAIFAAELALFVFAH
jgi:hypothetical protein